MTILLGVARANFLSLAVVCIVLAAAASWQAGATLSGTLLALVLLLALCAHISANAFNEYFDFKSGLDFLTERTPFSGGSGTLVANPSASGLALWLGITTLAIAVGIGLYLSQRLGWHLLLIGIPGVVLIYTYTQHLNRSPLLCLIAPGIGFGLMMTLGAFWVLNGGLTSSGLVVSFIVALLVSNLLLLNQFPDVEADRQVGRRHLPIAIGRHLSAVLYSVLLILSFVLLVGAVITAVLPKQTLLALTLLVLLPKLFSGIFRFKDQPDRLNPYLGLNVLLCHLYPLLLAIGLIWAGPTTS